MRLLLFLVVSGLDVVEAELVNILGRRNNAVQDINNRATVMVGSQENIPNPVTQSVLLEELFGEVLQVPLGQGDVGGDGDLGVA